MAMTILTQASPGAPALGTGAAGRLIGILDFCLVTTLGWAKAFSGTNLAAYRAPTGNRRYLRVNDAAAADAVLRGYEAMTAISTGTGLFPTITQVPLANGPYVNKDIENAPAIVHPWLFLSNGVFFHLFIFVNSGAGGNQFSHFAFGDFPSFVTGDTYNTVLLGNDAITAFANTCAITTVNPPVSPTAGTSYVPRRGNGTGTSMNVARCAANLNATLQGDIVYPVQGPGGLYLAPIYLGEVVASVSTGFRGLLPGVWACPHAFTTFTNNDTFSGANELAGRTFRWLTGEGYGAVVETSDTWGF